MNNARWISLLIWSASVVAILVAAFSGSLDRASAFVALLIATGAGFVLLMKYLADEDPNRVERSAKRSKGGRGDAGLGPVGARTPDELVRAVNEDDADAVRASFRSLSPDTLDPWGEPLALVAARLASHRTVELFLDAGFDPKVTDPGGATLLHAVVRRDELVPLTDRLLDAGLPVDVLDERGHTPFLNACHSFCTLGMERLLAAGARPTVRDRDQATALHHLLRGFPPHDHTEPRAIARRARWIARLIELGVDPTAETKTGETALGIVAHLRNPRWIEAFLDRCDPEIARSEAGTRALTGALVQGNAETAKRLQKAGVPIDVWCALLLGDAAWVERAIAEDPDLLAIERHPGHRAGPIAFALRGGHPQLADALITAGANPTSDGFRGPLFLDLIEAGVSADLARRLLEAGYSEVVNQPDGDLYSPLHRAAAAGRADLVALLLEFGANRTARTERGRTPGDLATDPDVLFLLR